MGYGGYIRVSTNEQATNGTSLQSQREAVMRYCELHGLELETILSDEGLSAKDTNRPALRALLNLARTKKIEGIIVYRLDRLFRNLRDALETSRNLEKWGVTLHSVHEKLDTSTPLGRFFFQLMNSLSELERGTIVARIQTALNYKKRKGELTGRLPFGYNLLPDGKTLVPNSEEQAITRQMEQSREQGLTFNRIAVNLNNQAIPGKLGGRWQAITVQQILTRHEFVNGNGGASK